MQSTQTKPICICEGCSDPRFARERCRNHFQRDLRNGTIQRLDRSHQHRLTDVDKDNRTATCSICGPTRVKIHSNRGKVTCWTRVSGWAEKPRNPETARNTWLKSRYGITSAQYETMLESQGGACAICGTTSTFDGRRLAVDHCHESGRVRGLLCGECNRAIGLLGDTYESLLRAVEYLKRGND